YPAAFLNARWDLLALNRLAASFFPDFDSTATEDRNCLWLSFTNPSWRAAMVDWEESVAQMVAEYRASMAAHIDDPAWQTLVDRLHRASPEFTAVWERHDVVQVRTDVKRMRHPTAGDFNFVYTNLWLDHRPDARIVVLTPNDPESAKRLKALHRSL